MSQIRKATDSHRVLLHAALVTLTCLLCISQSAAWSQPKAFGSFPRTHHQQPSMYTGPASPTTQTPSLVAQKMLKNPGNPRIKQDYRPHHMQLSHSVLASCDTLPSFPTAHGLLSPETVMRLEDSTSGSLIRSKALQDFLKTYRRHGPLSCLPMLSDPDVLPHLTQAMREIAA
jgi:hypothetical protein